MTKSKNNSDRRAISIHQPYAWLIVNGYKDVENRNNPPAEGRIGKRVYIHAAQRRITKAEMIEFLKLVKKLRIKKYPKTVDEFVYGAIIGSVVITGSTRHSKSTWAIKGYCHWNLVDAKRSRPRKMKGHQGLFYRF